MLLPQSALTLRNQRRLQVNKFKMKIIDSKCTPGVKIRTFSMRLWNVMSFTNSFLLILYLLTRQKSHLKCAIEITKLDVLVLCSNVASRKSRYYLPKALLETVNILLVIRLCVSFQHWCVRFSVFMLLF